jgi:hypothetical protein
MRPRSRCPILEFLPTVGTIAVSALVSAGMANAQFNQYTPPGGPQERPITREERLKLEMEAAKYHLGPIRLSPEAGIKDVAYVRNLVATDDGPPPDVTATVSAGFRSYLHTGSRVVWIGRFLPEYVWWQKRPESRGLNLSYGVEGLGFFNRLFVGVSAQRSEQQGILTPEVPELARSRADLLQATAEERWTGTFSSFATITRNRQKGLVDDLADPRLREIALLDRTEQVVRGGLRWRPRKGFTLGLGAERSQVDFDRRERDSSNSGTAPVLELVVDRHRLFFSAEVAARSLAIREGSRFVPFDGVTGNVALSIRPRRSLEIWTYGSRNLVYSLSPIYPYLDDRRLGLSAALSAGRRLTYRIFAEIGTNAYTSFSPATPDRRDTVRSFGGSLRFQASARITVSAQAARSRFDSNLPGNSRSFTSGGLSVRFGNLL